MNQNKIIGSDLAKSILFLFEINHKRKEFLSLLPTCHAINGNISPQITDVQ